MALNVYTNTVSNSSQHYLGVANSSLGKSIEKLSSGLRVNQASDDASGMAISEKLRRQIKGMNQASLNAQDAISYLQTAEGGMEIVSDMLQRMRELAVQASNGTYTANDRREIQKEIDQLKGEINLVSTRTEFNTQKVLSGSSSGEWSSSTSEIDVVFTGAPAEANYKLEFSVEPGQNAVYKTNILTSQEILAPYYPGGSNEIITRGGVEYEVSFFDTPYIPAVPAIDPSVYFDTAASTSGVRVVDNNGNLDAILAALKNSAAMEGVYKDKPSITALSFEIGHVDSYAAFVRGADYDSGAGGVNNRNQTYVSTESNGQVRKVINYWESSKGSQGDYFDTYGFEVVDPDTIRVTRYSENATTPGVFYSQDFTLAEFRGASNGNSHFWMTGSNDIIDHINDIKNIIFDGSTTNLNPNILAGDGTFTPTAIVMHKAMPVPGSGDWAPPPNTGTGADANLMMTMTLGGTSEVAGQKMPTLANIPKIGTDADGKYYLLEGIEAIDGKIYEYSVKIYNDNNVVDGSGYTDVDAIYKYNGGATEIPAVESQHVVVETPFVRVPDNAIGDLAGSAAAAGIENIQGNGDASILDNTQLYFSTTPPPTPIIARANTYSAHSAEANSYIGSNTALTINAISTLRNGYVEVSFLADTNISTANKPISAEFTFVDTLTGERRTLSPSNLMSGKAEMLDFGNGVQFDITIPPNAAGNIYAGDAMLLNVNSADSDYNSATDAIARLRVPGGGSAYAYIKNGLTKGATLTGVTLVDGEFKEAHVSWDVSASGLVRNRTVNLTSNVADGADGGGTRKNNFNMGVARLGDLPAFTDLNGRNVLDNTQTITIYGNNKQANIYLEARDTIDDLVAKLGKALVKDLEMGAEGVAASDLVQCVSNAGSGNLAVAGTIVIQSALIGAHSELKFSGDEQVLNALGFAQIQQARESDVTVKVTDAHTERLIGIDKISDRTLRGVIQGVELKFDSRLGTTSSFDEGVGMMRFGSIYMEEAFVHIKNKQTDVQIGANEGSVLDISIARVDTASLGIDNAYVMTQEDAQRALTKIEEALMKVSHARSSIGAQINRMENAMKNLSIGGMNMIASESKIRDLDVAEESANFAKNQLLVNASVSMLAQANQLPQTAMQLITR